MQIPDSNDVDFFIWTCWQRWIRGDNGGLSWWFIHKLCTVWPRRPGGAVRPDPDV